MSKKKDLNDRELINRSSEKVEDHKEQRIWDILVTIWSIIFAMTTYQAYSGLTRVKIFYKNNEVNLIDYFLTKLGENILTAQQTNLQVFIITIIFNAIVLFSGLFIFVFILYAIMIYILGKKTEMYEIESWNLIFVVAFIIVSSFLPYLPYWVIYSYVIYDTTGWIFPSPLARIFSYLSILFIAWLLQKQKITTRIKISTIKNLFSKNRLVEMKSEIKILIFLVISLAIPVSATFIFAPIFSLSLTQILDILTTILSGFAFVLALYALYFTHIKGPDINQIDQEQLNFGLVDKIGDPEEISERRIISRSINLQPFTLVFVNNGNRTGVIKKLKFKFTQSDDFSPFFTGFDFSFKNPDNSELQVPFTIKNGEVRLVKLDWARIGIRRFDSFNVKLQNHLNDSDIITVIKEMLNANKRELERFIRFLENNKSLGKCFFQWASATNEGETIQDITDTSEEIFGWYKSALQKWDDLTPSVNSIAIDVKKFLKSNIKKLKERLEFVQNFESDPRYLNSIFEKDRRPEIYNLILKWKKRLIDDLEELNMAFLKFDEIMVEYIRTYDDKTMHQRIFKILKEQKSELESKIEIVLKELNTAQEEIITKSSEN